MTYGQYCRLNMHVNATPRSVIRAAHLRLTKGARTRAQRGARHAWLRAILREHANAGALFRKFRF